MFDGDFLIPIFAFSIPVVAIVGGITAGIVRMMIKARMLELHQRERIAAIEHGIDPAKLAPPPTLPEDDDRIFYSPRQVVLNRSRGLMVGGIVTLAVGVGLSLMLGLLNDEHETKVWAVGLIPQFVGVALLISSVIMRRAADEDHGPAQPVVRSQQQQQQ
jgi:hypothetical protein